MSKYDFQEWVTLIKELKRDNKEMSTNQAMVKATALLYLQ